MTSVRPAPARPAQFCSESPLHWPATKLTMLAWSRCVSGRSAAAPPPMAAVMPGTTSTRTPNAGFAAGFDFLAAAPEDERVAALEADHVAPGERLADQ